MGLCEKHHLKEEAARVAEDSALKALHISMLDGEYFKSEYIRSELSEIQNWWLRSCNSLNYNAEDEVLQDEADAAMTWCISLAKELVNAERRYRNGDDIFEGSKVCVSMNEANALRLLAAGFAERASRSANRAASV